MNLISPPPDYILFFYFYFSTITLSLSWMIAPCLLYIVLTQSKQMRTVKWLILNHSTWCLILETIMCLVKPVFLTPSAGGYLLGTFRNAGSFIYALSVSMLCFGLMINCIISLSLTIMTRYLFVFPSILTKWLNVKLLMGCTVVITAFSYFCLILCFYPALIVDEDTMHEWALEYDPIMADFFHETSFFIIPHKIIDRVTLPALSLIILLMVLAVAFSIFFIYLILKFQKKSQTNFKKSLITSSVMQICLTLVFLLSPILAFFIFITFDVPHTSTIMTLFMCLLMSHCLVEFLATLYFIQPYRLFILKVIRKPKPSYIPPSSTSNFRQVSVVRVE